MTKLSVKHYVKNLKLIERNKEWLLAPGVSSRDKWSYYGHIALSYAVRNKKVTYLGHSLFYDNPATPLNLQNYPHEISRKVLGNMHKVPKTVLDIGGNLGQFSITMECILKGRVRVDTFEPNSFIFEYLEKNTQYTENIRTFNYGLGDRNGAVTLYFDPDRTGIGSVLKTNAGEGAIMSQEILITSSPEELTRTRRYDLVKIDVEGYEFHALKALKGLSFEYLFIELSGQGRKKDYMHSQLFSLIEKQWGAFEIYYSSPLRYDSDTFDVLLRIKSKKKAMSQAR